MKNLLQAKDMKRIMLIAFAALMAVYFSACVTPENPSSASTNTEPVVNTAESPEEITGENTGESTEETPAPDAGDTTESDIMQIKVSNGTYEIIFQLNDSGASKSLYAQLPMDIAVENYGGNEKIFYPEPLNTENTPLLESGSLGTLAYFAPWADVIMYYGECGSYSGLYLLGEAISGAEDIPKLTGILHLEKIIS